MKVELHTKTLLSEGGGCSGPTVAQLFDIYVCSTLNVLDFAPPLPREEKKKGPKTQKMSRKMRKRKGMLTDLRKILFWGKNSSHTVTRRFTHARLYM